jgi:hypothetical protein
MLVIRKQLDLSASGGMESHGVSSEQHFHRWDSICSNVFFSSNQRSAARTDGVGGIGSRVSEVDETPARERCVRIRAGRFRNLRMGACRALSRQSDLDSTWRGPLAAHAAAGRTGLCCSRAGRILANSTCANMFEMLRSVRTALRNRLSVLSSRPGLRRAYKLLAAGHILAPNLHEERVAAEVARLQSVPNQTSQEASPMPDCIVSHLPFRSYPGRASPVGTRSCSRSGRAVARLTRTRSGTAPRAGAGRRCGKSAAGMAGAWIGSVTRLAGASR